MYQKSLFAIMDRLAPKRACFATKEAFAEEIARTYLREVPGGHKLNISTLRGMIFNLLDYNRSQSGNQVYPYTKCCGSSYTMPFDGGSLTLTAGADTDGEHEVVLKVCPNCQMTAHIGDPICPNCNHEYVNHETEEKVAIGVIASVFGAVQMEAAKKIVVQDDVEGFTVTEADVNKYMTNVDKYIPLK